MENAAIHIHTQLTQEDFLVHQLFVASQSPTIKQKRTRMRWIIPILYGVIGALLWGLLDQPVTAIVLLAAGIAWFFFYPAFSRSRYRKHYVKYIDEQYKNRVNQPIEINIDEEYIHSRDAGSEGKIKITEVDTLVSLPAHFLIRMRNGQSFIVPKNAVPDAGKFIDLFRGLGIGLKDYPNWEWK